MQNQLLDMHLSDANARAWLHTRTVKWKNQKAKKNVLRASMKIRIIRASSPSFGFAVTLIAFWFIIVHDIGFVQFLNVNRTRYSFTRSDAFCKLQPFDCFFLLFSCLVGFLLFLVVFFMNNLQCWFIWLEMVDGPKPSTLNPFCAMATPFHTFTVGPSDGS